MNEMKGILLPGEPREVTPELPQSAMMLFAPVDKRAFGAAIGTVVALGVALLTAAELLLDPQPSINPRPWPRSASRAAPSLPPR